jgi:hypothetical protein
MSPTNFTASPSQADQSESLEAISSMAAVFSEVSNDPKKALSKPIGEWLPWLQEEGYSSEGFDRLLMSIVHQDNQAQDFELLSSTYWEGKNTNQSTLRFLLTLRNQYPDLFRHCFGELTKYLTLLEDTNALAGGKLTGPTATFIKKHPVVSTELLALGLTTTWLLIEVKLTHDGEQSLRASIEKNAISTTVDDTESSAIQGLSNRTGDDSLDPELILDNLDNHPRAFIDNEAAKVDWQRSQLLTPVNADKFVKLAMKDEAEEFLSEEEKLLLEEVKAGRSLWDWADNADNKGQIASYLKQRNEAAEYIQNNINEEDVELVKQYIVDPLDRTKITWNQFYKLKREYSWLDLQIYSIESSEKTADLLKNQAFRAAYQHYVDNGSYEKLNKALATLVNSDMKNNTVIKTRYHQSEGYLDGLIEEDEGLVVQDILKDTLEESKALVESFASDASDDLIEYLTRIVQAGEDDVVNFLDDKI